MKQQDAREGMRLRRSWCKDEVELTRQVEPYAWECKTIPGGVVGTVFRWDDWEPVSQTPTRKKLVDKGGYYALE